MTVLHSIHGLTHGTVHQDGTFDSSFSILRTDIYPYLGNRFTVDPRFLLCVCVCVCGGGGSSVS